MEQAGCSSSAHCDGQDLFVKQWRFGLCFEAEQCSPRLKLWWGLSSQFFNVLPAKRSLWLSPLSLLVKYLPWCHSIWDWAPWAWWWIILCGLAQSWYHPTNGLSYKCRGGTGRESTSLVVRYCFLGSRSFGLRMLHAFISMHFGSQCTVSRRVWISYCVSDSGALATYASCGRYIEFKHPGLDPRARGCVYKDLLFPLPNAVVCFVLVTSIDNIMAKERHSPELAYTAAYYFMEIDWTQTDCRVFIVMAINFLICMRRHQHNQGKQN